MTDKIGYLQNDAKCPYCHKDLKRIPKRKTKCPHCSKTFYVRRRIGTKDRYIVTTENASTLEWERTEFKQSQDISMLESAINNLPEKSDNYKKKIYLAKIEVARENYDEAWELFNSSLSEALSAGDRSFYREITFTMAEQHNLLGNYKQAIFLFCVNLYYSICEFEGRKSEIGNLNHRAKHGFTSSLDSSDNYSIYKPAINCLRAIIYENDLKEENFNDLALEACEQAQSELQSLLRPADALPIFVELVYGAGELDDIF